MIELNNGPDKPHRKCARIVGDTMGKYLSLIHIFGLSYITKKFLLPIRVSVAEITGTDYEI